MLVVLGLGNPGDRYAGTRHSIGHEVVKMLAARCGVQLDDQKDTFAGGAARIGEHGCYLAVSRTFMNLSGEAARGLWNKLGRQVPNLIVVHDDIDLPPGKVRLKSGGGDGGQKGVRSISQMLGDPGFIRVKVGVGRPEDKADVSRHVLTRFTPEEKNAVAEALQTAVGAVEMIVTEGLEVARSRMPGGK